MYIVAALLLPNIRMKVTKKSTHQDSMHRDLCPLRSTKVYYRKKLTYAQANMMKDFVLKEKCTISYKSYQYMPCNMLVLLIQCMLLLLLCSLSNAFSILFLPNAMVNIIIFVQRRSKFIPCVLALNSFVRFILT